MRCLRVLWMSLMFVSLVSAVALAEKDNELDSVRHLIDTGQHDQAQQRLKAFMARHSGVFSREVRRRQPDPCHRGRHHRGRSPALARCKESRTQDP